MITKEVPHFCFLISQDIPDKFEYSAMRDRALSKANSTPNLHTLSTHPKGSGLIDEQVYVKAYWSSINSDLKEILKIISSK